MYGAPQQRSPTGKPLFATSSNDGWVNVENSRLHREIARLKRELEAYTQEEGQANLMEVQLENARLAQEVSRLKAENAKLRGKVSATTRDACCQAAMPYLSPVVGWSKPDLDYVPMEAGPPGGGEDFGGPEIEAVGRAVRVPHVPRPSGKVTATVETTWLEYGGDVIEPLVRSGAVAFVDATWIIEAAAAQLTAVTHAVAAKKAEEVRRAAVEQTRGGHHAKQRSTSSHSKLGTEKVTETLQPGALPPRQRLPPEAFISINELKAAGCPHSGLPLFIVSW